MTRVVALVRPRPWMNPSSLTAMLRTGAWVLKRPSLRSGIHLQSRRGWGGLRIRALEDVSQNCTSWEANWEWNVTDEYDSYCRSWTNSRDLCAEARSFANLEMMRRRGSGDASGVSDPPCPSDKGGAPTFFRPWHTDGAA